MIIKREDTNAAITLPDSIFEREEFNWSPLKSNVDISLQGNIVVEQSKMVNGRPIVMSNRDDTGWVKRSVVEQIESWVEVESLLIELTSGTGSSQKVRKVIFDTSQNALEAKPVSEYFSPSPDDPFTITLRFLEVKDVKYLPV